MKTYIFVISIFIAVCALAAAQEDGQPTEGEKQVCKDNANGREFDKAEKDRRLSCNIVCHYKDGSKDTYKSPDNQRCCDMSGGLGAPTGTCQDGSCKIGNMG